MSVHVSELMTMPFGPASPPADSIWKDVFLAFTQTIQPATKSDLRSLNIRKLILAELLRNKWDTQFRVTGLSREQARYFKALGVIATRLLDLITSVQEMKPELLGNEHPAICWTHLVMDAECLAHCCLKTPISGKEALRSLVRSENKRLRNFENPFTTPTTREFFDIALNVCEQSDQIRKNALAPFIKSRSHFVNDKNITENTHVFDSPPNDPVRRIRQGRKPQKVFDSETF